MSTIRLFPIQRFILRFHKADKIFMQWCFWTNLANSITRYLAHYVLITSSGTDARKFNMNPVHMFVQNMYIFFMVAAEAIKELIYVFQLRIYLLNCLNQTRRNNDDIKRISLLNRSLKSVSNILNHKTESRKDKN